jgi:predicted regulator of Ras-like GTPase activity (Roadblock/LC7/MglB family)
VIRKAPVATDVVSVPLSDISDGWPDPVRQEIARGEWDLAMVVFPVGRLEPGLKTGRLKFTWGEIRQWLNPPIGSISSPHIDVPVELPLQVIAPLFMAARRPVEQKKVNIGENIPDIFAGLKAGAARVKPALEPAAPVEGLTEIAESVAAEPRSAPPVAVRPAAEPVVSHAPRPDTLGTIFGQPLKSEWSPTEIAQRICALDGVAGVVITMGDGLLVAGHVPPPQSAETLAAFLPQIFARLNQYAGEMQLGTLSGLHLSTAEAPCAIYKAGKLYIGALGQRGQALPEAQLQRIASEIGKRNP